MNDANFSTKEDAQAIKNEIDTIQYRTVSKSAVVCVVFAILGLLSFSFPIFVFLPLLSIGYGLLAMYYFRRFPDQLSGRIATKMAMIVSGIVLVSSVSMHAYVYATEVPDGYQRISFYDLKPKKNSRTMFSKKSDDYDGEKVFLKGYVRPGMKKNQLKKFILVGDFGSCCFGGNPEITDVVAVSITNEDDYVNYGYRLRRIGGDFKIHRHRPKSVQEKDLPYVIYEIDADYVK